MKRDQLTVPYSSTEFLELLDRMDNAPFVLYYDRANQLYRIFATKERRDIWVAAYEAGEMTEEIAAYEFTESFTAPAPYTINIHSLKDNQYVLQGSTGTCLEYSFGTVDGNGGELSESVDAYYTFRSTSGTHQTSKIYNAGTSVSLNIDEYLHLGTNTITILLRGRSTGTTKTVVVTYYVVQLDLTTTFDIARSINKNTNFTCTYTVTGQADKTVEFYIDGSIVSTANISSLESTATRTQTFNNINGTWGPGKHTLQVRASMMAGDSQFYSNLLYYEFVITGIDQTVILMEYVFPNTQSVFVGNRPGIYGEQYVSKIINWAYYSSGVMSQTATVVWRLYTEAGVETTLATRNADVVEGEVDVKPDPLIFMPTEVGDYNLQALIGGRVIESYTISVIANTNGVLETTEGMTMKLSGLGRSNEEPTETLTSWADRGHKCTFYNMPFNANAGYNEDAVWFNNGATGIINIKPFSEEVGVQSNNGNVVEVDFETFNVDDENAVVFRIGNDSGPSLAITSNKAVLKSRLGTQIVARFKSDERVKLAFITHPNSNDNYARFMFIQNNGVLAPGVVYDTTDTFNIGTDEDMTDTYGMIHIGNAEGKCGIKIYYIRTYNATYNAWQGLNNYMIDSDKDISILINKNNIFQHGSTDEVDIDKLEGQVNLIKITADINPLIATSSKTTVSGAMEVTFPEDSSLNISCANAEFSNAGQSTLGLHMSPSMHCKLDKNGNVVYDRDGQPLPKNRWAFIKGRVPEKKLRLQANPMESSGCHNGAFLNMINKVYPNVQIDGRYVLRTPIQQYILSGQYAKDMVAAHGGTEADYKFPYTVSFTPQSIPCVIVWRKDENTPYSMLGNYVMMEEKKSNYANGMHSIYDKKLNDGTLDPFDFRTGNKGNRIWDNEGCAQFENLRNHKFTLFTGSSNWNATDRALAYEKEYPDDDDQTPEEIEASWQNFYEEMVKPLGDTYGDQEAFDAVVWNIVDIYHTAAYYCLVLRQCLSDSLVRNLEWTRYEIGGKWIPKFWDADMQCGLMQDYTCDAQPMTDRDTILKGAYVLSGRDIVSGESSWFWDAAENNAEFKRMVNIMDQALFDGEWTYENITAEQDKQFVEKWSQSLYNKDGDQKYVSSYLNGYNYLSMFQGDRTSHRHWFQKTSYDYWDAKRAVGEYKNKVIYVRAPGAPGGAKMHFVAGATSIFGYGLTQDIIQTGISANKGETFDLTIQEGLQLLINDPINIYAANKIESVDMHEIAINIAASVEFANSYDNVTGTLLKNINLGVEKKLMSTGVVNTHSVTGFTGLDKMNRLETFNIQGQSNITNGQVDISNMTNLKNYLAAGSNIVTFNPAGGNRFEDVQLPLTVTSMVMNGVSLTPVNNNVTEKSYDETYTTQVHKNGCSVTWWNNHQQITMPTGLTVLRLSGMGADAGTHELLHQWLQMLRNNPEQIPLVQITYRNINWVGISVEDLLTLGRIPKSQRDLTGYVKADREYTTDEMNQLMEMFGDNIFSITNSTSGLCCDCDSANIIISASGTNCTVDDDGVIEILQGTTAQFQAVGFPLVGNTGTYQWYVYLGGEYVTGSSAMPNITFGKNVLHYSEGLLTTTECSADNAEYLIYCERSTGGNGSATIRIKKRTYPTHVDLSLVASQTTVDQLEGVYQILNIGHYLFQANHSAEGGYTGTMKDVDGGVWELDGADDSFIVRCTTDYLNGHTSFDQYCMQITDMPQEEYNMTLHYTSNWKNGLSLTATPLQICLITTIYNALTDSRTNGNPALYAAIDQLGISHEDANSFNSMELKTVVGTLRIIDLLNDANVDVEEFTSFDSGGRNVLKFLKNVTELDVEDCTALENIDTSVIRRLKVLKLSGALQDQTIDVSQNDELMSVSASGTTNIIVGNILRLSTIKLGSPSMIDLNDNVTSLVIDDVANITEINFN